MSDLLWRPDKNRIKNTNMNHFIGFINSRYDLELKDYTGLYEWSIENIPDFWASVWEYADIKHSQSYDRVLDNQDKMPGAKWFEGARLNFAENLLKERSDRTAIIFKGEDREIVRLTYNELYEEVAGLANGLKKAGIVPGDRVAGFMPNMPETVAAMLAAASLGAVWSSCSPDFGQKGVLDRLGQIRPKVLFAADGYNFKGKSFDSLSIVKELINDLPDLEKVIITPYVTKNPDLSGLKNSSSYHDFKEGLPGDTIEFAQLPFEHPLYIMFTSGTTGLPKCMVQSQGGVLLNHVKEHLFHVDLKPEDTIFYFSTCGWMMWNWLVSSLATGSTMLLYDGAPFHPHPGTLFELAQDEGVSIFGTSAGYIQGLMNEGVRPGAVYDLSSLKAVLSTGSPLSDEAFRWVYQEIKPDLHLASISGGSDINGCFAGGNPMGPVYAGELQARSLGMKVAAFDEDGQSVINTQGELVCLAPSPSMPIYFWDDPDGRKYHEAYFDIYPGVWRHGDFIEINDHGGVVIYGRSDATLNPGGVRIGTSEIYRQVEVFDEVLDSVAIGQEIYGEVRVILFVKMAPNHELDQDLMDRIRNSIRRNASPRHVPAKVLAVPDIPYTMNMKKVELAVKRVVMGQDVPNLDALMNPEALEFYKNIPELTR